MLKTTAPRATMSRRRSLTGMAVVILALHVVGWGTLVLLAATHHFPNAAGAVFGVGLGVTVYALGLRHAFDADHIAAIDNTTRSLVQSGQRPVSVGFWFSLGHSTVVFVVCLLLAFGVRVLADQFDDGTHIREIFGTFGLIVSATFLIILAIVNLGSFIGTAGLVRRVRQGERIDDEQLVNQGAIARLFAGRFRAIRKPWQIYPVGVLFGLGFDTATEVGLLALTGTAAAMTLPWYAILALPLIFAAGMALLDTIDGVFMNHVYHWAFDQPGRKLYYNMVVTGVSIVFALGIGVVELATLLSGTFHITSGPLASLGAFDLQWIGFILAGIFVVVAVVVFLRSRRKAAHREADTSLTTTSPSS
ncbi:MAG: HoxN/HupN/NixA family nickel/cobalt transporter [Propionibacteriaceae bacterium]|nr:HoxN/HupN/NixA family nickel/cobalt transporter [Propionibacteriaceae bacterium]